MMLGYARVSTKDQILDRQIHDLTEYGCERIFAEKQSGTNVKKRTELERLLDCLRPGDVVVISDLTRLSRSLRDLFVIIDKIKDRGADVVSLKETWLNTTTPEGKMMFTIFGCLAEFERDIISRNTIEGLDRARERGRKGGRPRIDEKKIEIAIAMYRKGISVTDIVFATGLSRQTVYNYIAKYKKEGLLYSAEEEL